MNFLALRLDEHDSSVCYSNGTTVKYYKPERHYQVKHFGYNNNNSNNYQGWYYACSHLGIDINKVDAIAMVIDVFRHPYLPKEDPNKLYEIIDIPYKPFSDFKCPIYRVDHHYAHSLSSWMLTDTKNHAVLDGYGDLKRTISIFKNNKLQKSYTYDQLKSFGNFMGHMGYLLGMEGHIEDLAGKTMALQSFGLEDKRWEDKIKELGIEQSSFVFDVKNYVELFKSEGVAKLNLINYLRTSHKFFEEKLPDFFKKYFTEDTLTYSGGVAHNVCANTKLKNQFKNIIIPPHCADEGLTLGCIEFLRQHYDQPKFKVNNFPFWQTDIAPERDASSETIKSIAGDLANGEIIGWYQGHGEIGPRALGHRSILMSPEVKDGKNIINKKVKHREEFRPFAASIKLDQAKKYFNIDDESNYMKYSVPFKGKVFDSISHIDNTSRIQTVANNNTHKIFYELLDEFEKLTGIPMLLNTSLNDNGKPIAGSPEHAIKLLKNSELDKLVVGDIVLK